MTPPTMTSPTRNCWWRPTTTLRAVQDSFHLSRPDVHLGLKADNKDIDRWKVAGRAWLGRLCQRHVSANSWFHLRIFRTIRFCTVAMSL